MDFIRGCYSFNIIDGGCFKIKIRKAKIAITSSPYLNTYQ